MKHTIAYIKYIALGAIAVAATALSGCINDPEDFTPVQNGDGGVVITLDVPGMEEVTRSVKFESETKIEKMHVLLFNAAEPKQYITSVAVTPFYSSESGTTQASVKFPAGLTGNLDVMVVANAGGLPITAMSGLGSNFTKSAYQAKLNFTQYGVLICPLLVTWPDEEQYLPMYGETTVSAADFYSKPTTVEMTRAHARVDVKMSDAVSKLEIVRVVNPFKQGSLIPSTTKFQPNMSAGTTPNPSAKDLSPSNKKSVLFYLMESPAVTVTNTQTEIEEKNATFLIIQATWNGAKYLYRVNFTSDGTFGDVLPKGTPIPVLRNYRYELDILEVRGPGYATWDEAARAWDETNNLSYRLITIDESKGQGLNFVYDGNYFLRTDKTDFKVALSGVQSPEYLEVNAFTNYSSTHANAGWHVENVRINNVLVINTELPLRMTFPDAVSPSLFPKGEANQSGKVRFTVSSCSTDRTLTFDIVAGKLRQTITINQNSMTQSPATASIESSGPLDFVWWYRYSGEHKLLQGAEKIQIHARWKTLSGNVTLEEDWSDRNENPCFGANSFQFGTGSDLISSTPFASPTYSATYSGSAHIFDVIPVPTGMGALTYSSFQYSSYGLYDGENRLSEFILRSQSFFAAPSSSFSELMAIPLDGSTTYITSLVNVPGAYFSLTGSPTGTLWSSPEVEAFWSQIHPVPLGIWYFRNTTSSTLTLYTPNVPTTYLPAGKYTLDMNVKVRCTPPYGVSAEIIDYYPFKAYCYQPFQASYNLPRNTDFGAIRIPIVLSGTKNNDRSAMTNTLATVTGASGVIKDNRIKISVGYINERYYPYVAFVTGSVSGTVTITLNNPNAVAPVSFTVTVP